VLGFGDFFNPSMVVADFYLQFRHLFPFNYQAEKFRLFLQGWYGPMGLLFSHSFL
jgi:hypothetical protein